MDWTIILTAMATAATVIGFVYGFLRNFKADIGKTVEKMEARIDTLEERMFLLATGKSLADAIVEERIKRKEKEV